MDDEMMRAALQDQIELVQYILRIIMKMPDLTVTRMETQKDLLQPGQGRSLTLDVWAVDSDGTQYNIEVQRDSSGGAGPRARYYGAVIDGDVQAGDEELAALAHDFRCVDPEKMLLEPLADRMRFLKNTEKGRTEMSSVIEQYARQEADKAAAEATDIERRKSEQRDLQRACQLFATGKLDISKIAALFNLDIRVLSQACGLEQA